MYSDDRFRAASADLINVQKSFLHVSLEHILEESIDEVPYAVCNRGHYEIHCGDFPASTNIT